MGLKCARDAIQRGMLSISRQFEEAKQMYADVAYYANKNDKSVTSWLTNLTSLYTNVCKGIDVYMKDVENKRNVKSTALQLQKMPLPKFDGDVRKYARFKSDFF